MRLYPIRFKPILKEKIWGSRRLGSFLGKRLPAKKKFGESWLLVDRPGNGEVSVVENGWSEGKTIRDLIQEEPELILGPGIGPDEYGRFPLLFKFLDARENLSIQVHPDERYANHRENDSGKIEAWYVVEADEDAKVIRGVLPDVTPENLVDAIREDRPLDVLNCVDVRPGDVILIPPGIVHSIGGGVLLYVVQKNSDVTYRIYDWNRLTPEGKSRELHLEKALDVIDFDAMGRTRARSSELDGPWEKREILVRSPVFQLEKIVVSDPVEEEQPGETFHVMTCVSGSGYIRCGKNRGMQFGFRRGECFLIPAGMDDYGIEAKERATFIKTTPTP